MREIDSRISFGDDSLLAETGENAEGGYDDLAGVNFEGGEALGHFAEPRRVVSRALAITVAPTSPIISKKTY